MKNPYWDWVIYQPGMSFEVYREKVLYFLLNTKEITHTLITLKVIPLIPGWIVDADKLKEFEFESGAVKRLRHFNPEECYIISTPIDNELYNYFWNKWVDDN